MPVANLEVPPVFQLESSHQSDALRSMVTAIRSVAPVKLISELKGGYTPDTKIISSSLSSNDTVSSASVSSTDTDELGKIQDGMKKISISDHKRLELEGKHKIEPMLAENPGRFVLFPIQHPEVTFTLCTALSFKIVSM